MSYAKLFFLHISSEHNIAFLIETIDQYTPFLASTGPPLPHFFSLPVACPLQATVALALSLSLWGGPVLRHPYRGSFIVKMPHLPRCPARIPLVTGQVSRQRTAESSRVPLCWRPSFANRNIAWRFYWRWVGLRSFPAIWEGGSRIRSDRQCVPGYNGTTREISVPIAGRRHLKIVFFFIPRGKY